MSSNAGAPGDVISVLPGEDDRGLYDYHTMK